jgi:thioester reductase-like protein
MAEVVLLTGYPSLLARSVCAEIVASSPQARVHAIVRTKFTEEARTAVEELLPEERARVSLVEGDAAAIDFGLAGTELERLAADVTHIHHCAQVTYLGVERDTAEHLNVGGAREAVEVASACPKLEALVHHSTAHVSGDRRGLVREDELKEGQSFRTVVEETKARAERVMRAASRRLPVVVVRPATIVGDSRTGEVDRFDGPYLLILLVLTSPPELAIPLPGRGDAPLDLVPIDWVARATVALGREPRARGGTFHLVDRDPLTARRVFELVARAGGRRGPRGSIPTNLAKALLRAPGLDRIAKSPRAFLETLTTPVVHDATRADEMLESLGVEPCPPLESYVEKLVQYVQERLRRRRASHANANKASFADVEDPLG